MSGPTYLYHGFPNNPTQKCSINGLAMAQNIIAPAMWAQAIIVEKPATVVEIGTQDGGLSSLLSSCVATYGGEFHTFDVVNKLKHPLHGNATLHLKDCFVAVEEISNLIHRPGTTFLLCDGGNKIKEWNTFAPHLKPGDVIAAHDWYDVTFKDPSYNLFWDTYEAKDEELTMNGLKHWNRDMFRFTAWQTAIKQ
jgi:hypothetical protein